MGKHGPLSCGDALNTVGGKGGMAGTYERRFEEWKHLIEVVNEANKNLKCRRYSRSIWVVST